MEIFYLLIGLVLGAALSWLYFRLRNAQYEEKNKWLEENIAERKQELEEIQQKMRLEFSHISNKIFEEKSTKFLDLNERKVKDILDPLKERITDFEKKVEDTYKESLKDTTSLKQELEHMAKLNLQISEEAAKLTNALKGDKKMQGDWGEVQLERLLEYAGLEKDVHYSKQVSLKNEEGKTFQPDYIINIPDRKHLVLDSKVSLVAYEQYFNEDEEAQKPFYLKKHIANLRNHIKELSEKRYQQLYNIHPPDYVIMFIPIEPSLYLALKEDPKLYEEALNKNIVLVSTSTLIATMRTIAFMWKQENQKRNVVEIAEQSGKLYDKFVGFTEDLINLGRKLDGVQTDYKSAMNKLKDSDRKGDTIVGRMEKMKQLGAKTTKAINPNLVRRVES